MKRGVSRQAIKTRAGIRELRVERRAINRPEQVRNLEPSTEPVVSVGDWLSLGSLADDIARRLRDRTAFPKEFWQEV